MTARTVAPFLVEISGCSGPGSACNGRYAWDGEEFVEKTGHLYFADTGHGWCGWILACGGGTLPPWYYWADTQKQADVKSACSPLDVPRLWGASNDSDLDAGRPRAVVLKPDEDAADHDHDRDH